MMMHLPLPKTRLALALSLITLSTGFSASAYAAAKAQVAVAHLIEQANSTPASMCFVLNQNQSVLSELNNLNSFLELTSPTVTLEDLAALLPASPESSASTSAATQQAAATQAPATTNTPVENATAGHATSTLPPAPAEPVHPISASTHLPLLPLHAHVENGTLCLSQLKHGVDYTLTLKKGLKLTNGAVLGQSVDVPFKISDAPSQIRLPYNIVLPKNARNTSFSITSINQDKFKLSLFRIPSSTLHQLNLPDLFENTIDNYKLISLLKNAAHPLVERIIALEPKKNEFQSTTIDLKDFVSDADDGLYLIMASDPRIDSSNYNELYSYSRAQLPFSAKILMITDLGMSTYSSEEGVLVSMRSLTTAEVLPNIHLDLISKSNEILASVTTDENGVARFPKEVVSGQNALAPKSIIAYGEKDVYNFDFDAKPLYLEDNKGVTALSDHEVFAWTDRGIYREGETVHYTALVRNTRLEAERLPLTLTIYNPVGIELEKVLLKDAKTGGYAHDFTLPTGTKYGRCKAVLSLGDKELSSTDFTVGTFTPFQIQSTLLNHEPLIQADTAFTVKSKTQFNYGGAASNLSGAFQLKIEPDASPVICNSNACSTTLTKFHFGPDVRDTARMTRMENIYDLSTDVEGVLQKKIKVQGAAYPQKVTLTSSVYDTGHQEVKASKTIKVSYDQPLIGIRQVQSTTHDVGFALCSCLQDGSTSPQDVNYYLYREYNDYNFVYNNGRWQYINFKSRDLVNQGSIRVDNQDLNTALIQADLSDGSYILEVRGDTSSSTLAFTKGYLSAASADSPDRISVYTDKKQYKVGDDIVFSFESPFDGYANIALGAKGISDFQTFAIKQGHNEFKTKLAPEIYPQGHALITIFSPLPESPVGAVRAVGLSHIKLDLSAHELDVKTEVAAEIKPQSTIDVKVQVKPKDEQQTLEQAYARVSLVDNGILDLTGYKSPNPKSTLEQEQKYNVKLYDVYGYLMTDPQQLGQGYGDTLEAMESAQGLSKSTAQLNAKTVALTSAIVPVDADGTATVQFKVPQFSGSLKAMAVAWDQNKTGADAADVKVRDNAVASLGLPKFMYFGDKVKARLFLHNLNSSSPDFKYDITCSGALQCSTQSMSQIKQGMRNAQSFTITTVGKGEGSIDLKVMNPDFQFNERYQLEVLDPQLPLVRNYITALKPGESKQLTLKEDFTKVDALLVSQSALPGVNPQALVHQFDSHFDGDIIADLESKLLYGSLLLKPEDPEHPSLGQVHYENEAQLNHEIATLIRRIEAAQNRDGSFFFNDFFSAYATAVLLEAKRQSFPVNENALENALSYLRRNASQFDWGYAAYANQVLSSIESINQANIRHVADKGSMTAPLCLAHLANALLNTGDKERAATVLARAIENLKAWQVLENKLHATHDNNQRQQLLGEISNFNFCQETDLRHDAFVVLQSYLRADFKEQAEDLLQSLDVFQENPEYLSALTMSAMLRAAHTVDAHDKGSSEVIDLSTLKKKHILTLKNEHDYPVFATTSVLGNVKHAQTVSNNGILVNVNYFNKEGRVNPDQYQFRVNEEVLMEVNFTRQLTADADGLLRVKLPSGFEFVRRAIALDPSFGKLLKNVNIEDTGELKVGESEISTLWPDYNQGFSHSLFLVLRAALPGTFNQGEALLQLKKNPQYYGSCLNPEKLRVASDK